MCTGMVPRYRTSGNPLKLTLSSCRVGGVAPPERWATGENRVDRGRRTYQPGPQTVVGVWALPTAAWGMRVALIATRNPPECALATILSYSATANEESSRRTSVAL